MNYVRRHSLILGGAILIAGPLAGGVLHGLPSAFFEVPPLTQYVDHASFSLSAFLLFAVFCIAFAFFAVRPWWFGFRKTEKENTKGSAHIVGGASLPVWGWIGLALAITAWVLAWTRPAWFGAFRDHTFFPLWFGYILFVDGLVRARTGCSRLANRPLHFAALFPASAAAWWYFEYLNRFLQNWSYEGIAKFSAGEYVLFATLCFSTVLPAVFETFDLLISFRWFRRAYTGGPAWKPLSRSSVRGLGIAGAAGLVLLALAPNPFFFMTWLAPLAVLGAALHLANRETCFSSLASGDYTEIVTLACAALGCGFFWEMWNFWSLPKWHYSVPYVNAFRVFEMPAVGYGGYLPFGPICLCMWELVSGRNK